MANKNIHTVYNSDRKKWENKEAGSSKPLSSHLTKNNALDKGEKMSKNNNVENFIYGKNGKTQERNVYGNNPFPPKR